MDPNKSDSPSQTTIEPEPSSKMARSDGDIIADHHLATDNTSTIERPTTASSSEGFEKASAEITQQTSQQDDIDKHQQQSDSMANQRLNESCESPTGIIDENRIVKHIMVIGFHHKHGYQVDYCYPPLEPGGPVFSTAARPIQLPTCWKTLPLLCLPDGSHNYNSDTIYFTMPDNNSSDNNCTNIQSSDEGVQTIFGTACYRQIQADKLLNRTDDMTRVAVQKSVCVLSRQPLFGLIRSKLELITHAYFDELDFSKVRILKLTYENLNSLLARDSVRENATFLGLSARHLVSHFGCNMLVLFKAMLLEKKILFYKSPVRELCSTIMSMCSLFTGLLESGGLNHSTCDLQLSPTLLEALRLSATPTEETTNNSELIDNLNDFDPTKDQAFRDKVFFSPCKDEVIVLQDMTRQDKDKTGADGQDIVHDASNLDRPNKLNESLPPPATSNEDYEVINETEDGQLADPSESIVDDPYAIKLSQHKPEAFGLPLQIFTRGSFCLPYLSITYLDLLSDARVKSFVIGATNFLFKQRRELYDVIVDMEENTIVIDDPQLKKSLSLSIEDLRFMDYLSRHVKLDENPNMSEEFDPLNNDVTKWVGGDEWIRYHFKLYTLYLLRAAKTQTCLHPFNAKFIQTWKQSTNNYKIWESTQLNDPNIFDGLQARHPFSATTKGINLTDMKLKLSYAVSGSERGRAIVNRTLTGIGKWSIWNNIATAGNAAATTVSNLATSAATSTSTNLAATLPIVTNTISQQFRHQPSQQSQDSDQQQQQQQQQPEQQKQQQQ